MNFFTSTKTLTHEGTMRMLQAGIERAEQTGQPQCLVIVDASGEVSGELRMSGAKFLSRKSALAKAVTAASNRAPSANIPEGFRPLIAAATGGSVTGLPGGLPIMLDGTCVGGVGVGSGSGEQDIEVANAMLSAIGADTFE
ncbi:GlcG/HbpS family heme-binding protein [Hoeflea prorocentri]|uniref:Heme-binding protein n=1 Tax=Hoeflea prorocentri TaxID=1922333 RepID=A0A9X3UEA1_9HYPH|nr:heme-binding protein [Hoeflea prorocentri]MCY6379727.1 heme-binding protein [Hoeflea prorocentri]MDA5397527.1 heme-binding protein [Hoeflea prorocentri]